MYNFLKVNFCFKLMDQLNKQTEVTSLESRNSLTAEDVREIREDYQLPITDRYSKLNRLLEEVENKLVESFIHEVFSYLPPVEKERMEEYKKILENSNLRIVLSESDVLNACHVADKGIIIVFKGVLRNCLEQNLGVDGVAFIVAHEISHLLYNFSSNLSDKEKEGQLAKHDMEYQCDRDAVTLMDIAGYSPFVTTQFSVLNTSESYDASKMDYGILRSHPIATDRIIKLKEIVENGIWRSYSEGYNQDFSEEEKQEITEEVPISEQLQNARNDFEGRFYKDLRERLDELCSPENDNNLYLENDEVELFYIPETLKDFFSEFEARLSPEKKNYSKSIFLRAFYEIKMDFRFSFEEDLSLDPKNLLQNIRDNLPCRHEMLFNCENGLFYESLMEAFGRYNERIGRVVGTAKWDHWGVAEKKDSLADPKKLLSDEVVGLVKEGLKKFGIGFLLPRIEIEGDLGGLLEKVGSRQLVYRLAYKGKIAQLRKNKYCCEILDETLKDRIHDPHRVDISYLSDDKNLELLVSKDCPAEMKKKIIEEYLLPRITKKAIPPLELFITFNAIRDSHIDLNQKERQKNSLKDDFICAIHRYTENEPADVKRFFDEQILSLGYFPKKVFTLREKAALIKGTPSDQFEQGCEIVGPLPKYINYTYRTTAYSKETPMWGGNLTAEEAFTLGRFLCREGIHALKERKYFEDLENVSAFWKVASPAQVDREPQRLVNKEEMRDLSLYSIGKEKKAPSPIFEGKPDISSDCLTEPIGPKIEFRDYLFLKYLRRTKYKDLVFDKKEDAIDWVEKYVPRKGHFRDIVLTNIYKINNFESELKNLENKEFFLKFLSLYDENGYRRESVSEKIYQAYKDDALSIDKKLSFIATCFPHASVSRDGFIQDMLFKHLDEDGTNLRELQKACYYYSSYDRRVERKESILDGTLGSLISSCTIEEKMNIARWLFLGAEKPKVVEKAELHEAHVNLDFIKSALVSNEIRHKVIEMLFFGVNGIAAKGNEEYLNRFLDEVFDKHLSGTDDNLSKLGREIVRCTFQEIGIYKREKLLNRLFDLSQDESAKDIEVFLPKWVAGYSASAVKFLQIIGSRPEIEKHCHKLYDECKKAKSSAERMNFFDMIASMSSNEKLMSGKFLVGKELGSASIKAVLQGKSDEGEGVVIKVLRHSAGKYVSEEADELNRIVEALRPTLRNKPWEIETIPDIVGRACEATLAETDFNHEVDCSYLLAQAIGENFVDRSDIAVETPGVISFNGNIIVESMGYGQTMDKYLEQHPEDKEQLARYTQEIFLTLISKNVVLADLHQGNILVEKMESGKFKFVLIDTGSIFKLGEAEANVYKKIMLGMVISSFKSSEEGLFQKLIPEEWKGNSKIVSILSELENTLSPEEIFRSAIKDLLNGDEECYNKNEELISKKLKNIGDARSTTAKAFLFLEMLDDLRVEGGRNYYVSNNIYW